MIYLNFNLKKIDEAKTTEISVSLVAMSGNNNSNEIKPEAVANSTPKPEEKPQPKAEEKIIEKIKSPQESVKNQVKPQPKKITKAMPAKSAAKPIAEKKIPEFKEEEKLEEKQDEAIKAKEDPVKNKNQDDSAKDVAKKEENLGAKQKSNEEQQENKQQSSAAEKVDSAADLDSINLSAREKLNIQSQLRRCYKRAIDESGIKNKIKISVQLHVSEDGYIDSNLDEITDKELYKNTANTAYKNAIESVRRAIELCNPLRNLPLDKYEIWKDETLEFSDDQN